MVTDFLVHLNVMIKFFKRISNRLYLLFRVYVYWSTVLSQWISGRFWKGFFLPFKGYEPNKAILYSEMNKSNRKDYVSDYYRWVTSYMINNQYKYYFMDKLNFYFFMSAFTSRVCPVMGYYSHEGKFLELLTPQQIPFSFDRLIYKPNKGTKGQGIKTGNTPPRLSDFQKQLQEKKFSDYIVCPYLTQRNYASKIFSGSLNTIRVFTGILEGKSVCIRAVHRFGRSSVKDVDNFSKGGISANINIQTGMMDKACYFDGRKRVSVTMHPDTQEPVIGVKVEGWEEMISELLRIQLRISFIRYLAWDIAMVNDSFLIIEANHVSDVDLYQCHGSLITTEEHRRFFEQFR